MRVIDFMDRFALFILVFSFFSLKTTFFPLSAKKCTAQVENKMYVWHAHNAQRIQST